MESKNNIDKLFKDKLGNREFVIKESFLADLDGKLDAQKPNKKYWGIMFFAALLIVGASLTYYFMNSGDGSESINSQLSENKSGVEVEKETVDQVVAESSSNEESNTNIKTNISYTVSDSNQDNDQTNQVNEGNVSSTTNTEINNNSNGESSTSKSTSSSTNGNVIPDSNVEKLDESTSRSEKSQTEENTNNTNDNVNDEQGETIPSSTVSSNAENENSIASNDTISTNENSEDRSIVSNEVEDKMATSTEETSNSNDEVTDEIVTSTNESEVDSANLEVNANEGLIANSDTMLIDSALTPIDADTTDSESLANEGELTEEVSDTIAEESEVVSNTETNSPKSTKTKRLTVSLFGGPSLINKKISDSLFNNYSSIRKAEESNILTMSFGARVNYYFNQKVNASIGLNTVTYGEEVNYTSLYTISSMDTSYLQYTYTPFQDSMGQWDTLVTSILMDTTLFDSTSVTYSSSNRFSYLQIPIMVGYKFTFDKLSVNVRLGGAYGILLKSKGNYVNQDLYVQPADMKKSVINLVASTVVSYKLKGFNVFIEPKYRFNTGSIINESFVKQKYNALGCNFGISFNF